MKKLLALVLALVMVMGLATVGANAASVKYADADSITYKEAVDVLSEIGILGGDAAGFRPTDTLKRSEGAKIVTYLLLGNKAADALQGSGTRFTDLPANHWAAGYMEYLAAVGVMGGVGNGQIDPDGTLTAAQFAKMLLTALGYDADIEGLVGGDWAINTQRLATSVDLFDGNSAVTPSAAITREEAALYALNTLKTPLVEYSNKGSTVSVNGATINLGASKADYVTTTIAKTQTISDETLTNTNAYTIEFAERYYPDLVQTTGTSDAFERPATNWKWKNKSVGTYADKPTLTYTAKTTIGTLYADLGLTDGIAAANVTYYQDGAAAAWGARDVVKGAIGEANSFGGYGTLTEVYYKASAGTIKVVEVNTYVGKVSNVYAATSTQDAYVKIKVNDNFTAPAGFVNDYKTDEFKKDDIVTYTFSRKAGEFEIKSMALADKIEGTLQGYTTRAGVAVNGTAYRANKSSEPKIAAMNTTVTKDVKVYLDKYGYAVYVDADTTTTYAVVLGYEDGNSLDNGRAKLLFTDGSTKTVVIDKLLDYQGNALAAANVVADFTVINNTNNKLNLYDIVSYTINSDNEYTLKMEADSQDTPVATLVTNGISAIGVTDGNKADVAVEAQTVNKANGDTIFLIADTTTNPTTYTAYKGIANVPTIAQGTAKTAAAIAQSTTAGIAKVVFIAKDANTTVNTNNTDTIFVIGSYVGRSYTKDDGFYYEYDAYINGEAGKIKVDSSKYRFVDDTLIAGPIYNAKGILTSCVSYAGSTGTPGADTGEAATVTTNNKAYTGIGYGDTKNTTLNLGTDAGSHDSSVVAAASGIKVYVIGVDDQIRSGDIALTADANDVVFWTTNTNNLVDNLYIRVKDAVEAVTVATKYSVKASDPFTPTASQGAGTFVLADGIILTNGTAAAIDASLISNITMSVETYSVANGAWSAYATLAKTTLSGDLAATGKFNAVADRTFAIAPTNGVNYRVNVVMNFTDGTSLTLFSGTINGGA